MKRGEVWSATLPLSSGREQGGQRPVVVVQDASYGQQSPMVLAVPLTSQVGSLRFPATVKINPSPLNGLSLLSVALVLQVRATYRRRFVQNLGLLTAEDTDKILAELNKLTGQ